MEQADYKMVQELSEKYKIPGVGKRVLELWRQCDTSPAAFRRTLTGIVKSAEGDLTQEDVETLAQEAFATNEQQWNSAERAAYDATLSFYEAIARRETVISTKVEELAQLETEVLGYRAELRKANRGLRYLASTKLALERAEKKVKGLRSELKVTRKDRRSLRARLLMTEDNLVNEAAAFQTARDKTQSYRGELGELAGHTYEIDRQLADALARERSKLDREALLRAMDSYQSRARKVDTSDLRKLL